MKVDKCRQGGILRCLRTKVPLSTSYEQSVYMQGVNLKSTWADPEKTNYINKGAPIRHCLGHSLELNICFNQDKRFHKYNKLR